MDETSPDSILSRREISDGIEDLGWRYVLGVICTSVRVGSLAQRSAAR